MKKINVYYWLDQPNFGDALNIDICKDIFAIDPVKSSPELCEATFIGSTLDDFLFKGSKMFNNKYNQYYNRGFVNIWGSGFITKKNDFCRRLPFLPEQYFRRVRVHAVRGELSKKRLENITKSKLQYVVVGDPGLLASDLYLKREKKYKVGIIPHHAENDLPIFEFLHQNIKSSVIIRMDWDTHTVIRLISECETIISSAMHGLIVADGMGIPNMQIVASKRLLGGNYKFKDYYSSYGIYNWKSITSIDNINFDLIDKYIENNYMVSHDVVETKKKMLYDCFPYK